MPAAGGGVKGKRSVCRGRQDASLLCQAKRLPGTANGEKQEERNELRNILSPSLLLCKSQPCRARAPFVRFADIFPANGEICPPQRGPQPRRSGKPPLCKGRWAKSLILLGGIVRIVTIPQPKIFDWRRGYGFLSLRLLLRKNQLPAGSPPGCQSRRLRLAYPPKGRLFAGVS